MFSRFARHCVTLAAVCALAIGAARSYAFPKYAEKEKVKCDYCHVVAGGDRNFRGLYYKAHDLSFAEFDNVYEAKLAGVKPTAVGPEATATVAAYPDVKVDVPAVLDFKVKDIDGKPVNLARYKDDVILIVNVASKCGNTPQYASLQKLYDKYKAKGFVVLGFPANDFNQQEPGTNKEIKEFCTSKYMVTFPMFSKSVVKGEGISPLYKFLTDAKTDPKFGKPIDWNFAKFLVNRKGEIIARFPAGTDVMKPDTLSVIEKAVAEKAPEVASK